MSTTSDAQALADHLDAINSRARLREPTSNSAARLAKIVADSEAACAAMRRAEAEAEVDAAATHAPIQV